MMRQGAAAGKLGAALSSAIVSSDRDLLVEIANDVFNGKCCSFKIDGVQYDVSALFLATQLGRVELIPLLLEKGSDPTVIELFGDSAFSLALRKDLIEAAGMMLEAEVDFSKALVSKNDCNSIPLDYILSDPSMAGLLAKIASKGIRFEYLDDVTLSIIEMAAIEAIENETLDVIDSVVKLGWQLNSSIRVDGDLHCPPLFFACYCGSFKAVRALVSLGADVNCRDSSGIFAIECCLSKENEVYEQIACYLVQNGFGINTVLQEYGMTLLHAACSGRWVALELARLCIEKGADPRIPAASGSLVLCSMVLQGMVELARQLVSHQKGVLDASDFNKFINERQSCDGYWPLLLAVSNKDYAFVSLLLSSGADPNAVCEDDGRSCLHIAALSGDLVSSKLLVGAGADINLRSKDRLPTPLDFSINQNHIDVAVFLVLSGADIESKINATENAPTSIMLAPDPMKKHISDALQAFETFSSLRKLGMLAQLHGGNSQKSGLSESKPATPEKSVSPPMSSVSSKTNVSVQNDVGSKVYVNRPNSAESMDSLIRSGVSSAPGEALSLSESGGLSSAAQLQLWAERWGAEAALTHVDIINFLASMASSECESDSKATTVPMVCIICHVNRTDCTLLHRDTHSCGHVCVCMGCGRNLQRKDGVCPLCGEEIRDVIENIVLADAVHGKFYMDKRITNPVTARELTPRKKQLVGSESGRSNDEGLLSRKSSANERPVVLDMMTSDANGFALSGSKDSELLSHCSSPRINAGADFQRFPSSRSVGSDARPSTRQDSSSSLDMYFPPEVVTHKRSIRVEVPTLQCRSHFPKAPKTDGDQVLPYSSPVFARPVEQEPHLDPCISTRDMKCDSNTDADVDNTVPIRIVKNRPNSTHSSNSGPGCPIDAADIALRSKSFGTSLTPLSSPIESNSPDRKFTKARALSSDASPQIGRDGGVKFSQTSLSNQPRPESPLDDDIEMIDLDDPANSSVKDHKTKRKKKKIKSKHKKSEPVASAVSSREARSNYASNKLADIIASSAVQTRSLKKSPSVDFPYNSSLASEEGECSHSVECDIENSNSRLTDIENENSKNRLDLENNGAEGPDMSCSSCVSQVIGGLFRLLAVLIFYSAYLIFNPLYRSCSVIFYVIVACNQRSEGDNDRGGCSLGGLICSIVTFILGSIVYVPAFLLYCCSVSMLFVLGALQPDSFYEKYTNYKFIDLRNPLKPDDMKDELAGFSDINLNANDVEEFG